MNVILFLCPKPATLIPLIPYIMKYLNLSYSTLRVSQIRDNFSIPQIISSFSKQFKFHKRKLLLQIVPYTKTIGLNITKIVLKSYILAVFGVFNCIGFYKSTVFQFEFPLHRPQILTTEHRKFPFRKKKI